MLEALGIFLGFDFFPTILSSLSLEIHSTPDGEEAVLYGTLQPLYLLQIPLSPTPSQNPYTARSNGFGRDCMWLSEDFVKITSTVPFTPNTKQSA